MINGLSLDLFSFLIFLVPGFIMVWSFRYFTESKKTGDFEFLGLSVFCGLLNIFLLGLLSKWGALPLEIPLDSLEGLIATSFIFSLFSFLVGLVSAHVSKSKPFRSFINFLK